MAGVIAVSPKFYFPGAEGGSVDVYLAGTTTRSNTWQDRTQLTLNENPVELNARAECVMWLDSALRYKFVVKDADGATIYTVDNVAGAETSATEIAQITVDRFSGDGSDTTFTLSVDPGNENLIDVYVSGVYQQKNTFSLAGTTLTFAVAPASGTNNIEVVIHELIDSATLATTLGTLVDESEASATAAANSATNAATSATNAATSATAAATSASAAASSAADAADSAASASASADASGDVAFYDTKADADAALAGLPDLQIVEVLVDEDRSDLRTRYRVETGAYVFKVYLSSVDVLGDGNPAHSDGTNTITGSARFFIGNNTPSADDSALLIGRGLTGSYDLGAHAVRDESTWAASGTGFMGYASFDAKPVASGAATYAHLNGFQARQSYTGSGAMGTMVGYNWQPNQSGSGTVTDAYGFLADNATGAGTITNNYGFYCKSLTRGTNNFSFYSTGTQQFYHQGVGQFGGALTIGGALAGATTGAFSSQVSAGAVNITGNIASFSSGGLAQYYSGSGVAVTRAYGAAGGGGTAQLNIMGGSTLVAQAFSSGAFGPGVNDTTTLGNASWRWANVFTKYVKMTTQTVASLTAAATAGAGARAFVTDANATTFASVVAGGGSNGVPVYSDGTDWRIG